MLCPMAVAAAVAVVAIKTTFLARLILLLFLLRLLRLLRGTPCFHFFLPWEPCLCIHPRQASVFPRLFLRLDSLLLFLLCCLPLLFSLLQHLYLLLLLHRLILGTRRLSRS